ncbi:MAG: polysaccharide deacetylase family protein [Fastidiosipila sp.]|nr:polysaccharide deacetylase family protein [Fastidiosipila sp.]
MQGKLLNAVKNEESYKNIALVAYIGMLMLNSVFFRIAGFLGIGGFQWLSAMVPVLFLFIAFLISDKKKKKLYLPFAKFYICFLIYAILSYLFNPQNHYWFFESSRGVLNQVIRPDSGLYALLFLSVFPSDEEDVEERIVKYMTLGVWLIWLHDILQFVGAIRRGSWINLNFIGERVQNNYDLAFGYSMAFTAIFFMFRSRHTNRKSMRIIYRIMVVFNLITIFTDGSRGSLVIPFAFILILYLKNLYEKKKNPDMEREKKEGSNILRRFKKLERKKRILLVSLLAIVLIAVVVLIALSNSRNLQLLLSKNFLNDGGRGKLYGMVIRALRESPIFGLGLFGDRPVVNQKFVWGYSHNIILELMVDFGIILGLLLIIAYAYISVQMIFKEKNRKRSEWFIAFFAVSLGLLFSSSFWLTPWPWVTLLIYFKFSESWQESRKKISDILAGISFNTPSVRRAVKISIPVLLVVALLAGFNKTSSYDLQYRTEVLFINKPTVMVTFDATMENDYRLAYSYMNRKGLTGTSYLIPDRINTLGFLTEENIEEMRADGWDFQLGASNTLDLARRSTTKMDQMVKSYQQYFRENLDIHPISLSSPSTTMTSGVRKQLSRDFPIIKVAGRPDPYEDYYYKSLNLEDMQSLYALDLRVAKANVSKLELIKEQIDLAEEESALLIMSIPRLNLVGKINNALYTGYFYHLIDYLLELDFEFITMTELNNYYNDAAQSKID